MVGSGGSNPKDVVKSYACNTLVLSLGLGRLPSTARIYVSPFLRTLLGRPEVWGLCRFMVKLCRFMWPESRNSANSLKPLKETWRSAIVSCNNSNSGSQKVSLNFLISEACLEIWGPLIWRWIPSTVLLCWYEVHKLSDALWKERYLVPIALNSCYSMVRHGQWSSDTPYHKVWKLAPVRST